MCGIAGLVSTRGENAGELQERLRQMCDALAHRGPDDSGYWVDPKIGVALGQRRLAVVDLSPAGHQPMVSADQRWIITFNGEIYNAAEIKSRLSSSTRYRGHSDTEVFLEAIAQWGLDQTLKCADGMFAFGLWDRQKQRLALARDRFGEKPVYWLANSRGVAFSSELKPLLRLPATDIRLDIESIRLLLRLGYIPAPQSIVVGVKKLLPAEVATFTFDSKGCFTSRSTRFSDLVETFLEKRKFGCSLHTLGEATDALEFALSASVKQRMISDVPLGAFLSGGIDSSTIVALMAAQSSVVKTFTIGFERAEFDESSHARKVASHLGTDHTQVIMSEKDALDVVPKLAGIYDEPFADSSQIPTFLVSGVARRSVTVALCGDGGDELLGGYNRHLFLDRRWSQLLRLPLPVRRGIAGAGRIISPDGWNGLLQPFNRLCPGIPVRPVRPLSSGTPSRSIATV